jgi:hypothetical protein
MDFVDVARRVSRIMDHLSDGWDFSTRFDSTRIPTGGLVDCPAPVHWFGPMGCRAWCIVPFDGRRRTPEERVAMLERLGFERYAYDWRAEHLPDTARELRPAAARGIRVEAVWVWIEKDRPGQLSESNERLLAALREAGVSTQLWVGIAPGFFEGMTDEQKVAPPRLPRDLEWRLRCRSLGCGGAAPGNGAS